MNTKVSIVIPVRNEAENIEQLASEISEALSMAKAEAETNREIASRYPDKRVVGLKTSFETEVIFVNDASTDGTAEALDRAREQYAYVRIIALPERGGQAGCYRVAFREAHGHYVVRMDGDLQDDPRDLVKFYEVLEQQPDIVLGLRSLRRHRRMLRIATMIYDIMILTLFDSPLHTNSSSFVAFKSQFLRNLDLTGNDHRYLPLIAIRRGATALREVLIVSRDRIRGRSKYRVYTKVFWGVFEVFSFLWRLRRGRYDLPQADGANTTA